MTFFLGETDPQTKIKARQPRADVSSFWDGLGAATTSASIENDANFRAGHTAMSVRDDMVGSVIERLGPDEVWKRLGEKGLAPKVPVNDTALDMMKRNINWKQEIVGYGRDAAATDPTTWGDVDLSDEYVEAETNRRLQSEYQDARDIVEMMPSGQGMAEFIGGMTGVTADIKNLPFMFMGGGGSLLRIMGREAAINVAAETTFLPAQFDMAKRLEIPDPSIATQLTMAAGAGAILGGGVEAIGRGVRYWKGRNAPVAPVEGFDEINSAAMVDEAEDILASGRSDAFEQIAKIPERTERIPPHPENQIDPTREPLILRPDQRSEPPPIPEADAMEMINAVPDTQDAPDLRAEAEKASDELLAEAKRVRKEDGRARKPLINFLRQPLRGAENMQIHPEGMVGQELKSRGITPKTNPGLFSKNGRRDLDNISAFEMEGRFPGITEATGTQYGDNYLDRDGLIDVIARDAEGDDSWLYTRQQAAELERQAAEIDMQMEREADLPADRGSAAYDFMTQRDAGGLYIDKATFEGREAEIGPMLDHYLLQRGIDLSDIERAEILDELTRYGGDAEYLVELAIERDLREAESIVSGGKADGPQTDNGLADRQTPADDGSAGAGGDVRSEFPAGSQGQGAEGNAQPVRTEATTSGEQGLIEGVAPITQRDRLEAAQNAPMRGGNAAADDGLFDLGARQQADMFSDPASSDARPALDAISQDVRTTIDAEGDFDVLIPMDDGSTRSMKASEALDYLDEGDRFIARIDLCGKGPA